LIPLPVAAMSHSSSLKIVISRCHEELNRLFFLHQEAVLIGELPQAIKALHFFTRAHDLHKNFEDTHLLPRLAELESPGDWPVSLYHHEHNKIDNLMTRLETQLVKLNARELAGTELHFELIELLDREKTIKGLCEHHQEREEAGMLPALDQQTDEAWRTSIIVPFIDEWQATVKI
jgi:hypothetical protein